MTTAEAEIIQTHHDVASEAPTLALGESVGDYRVVRKIGGNALTKVYLAQNMDIGGAAVALKFFGVRGGEHRRSDRANVDRELLIHGVLSGEPGIMPVSDIGVYEDADGPHRYLATPYASGGSLGYHIARAPYKRLQVPEVLAVASDILPAIRTMRKAKVLHMDIKPDNILWTPDGWRLNDFGEAFFLEDVGLLKKTADREWLDPKNKILNKHGTVGLQAPEVVQGEGPIDTRADLYQLNATLYYALTGRLPFDFRPNDFSDYMSAVRSEKPTPPDSIIPSISHGLGRVLVKNAQPDPEDRDKSEDEYLDHLLVAA
jgi:eukaryotic-like serine/threonine-protein kinase